MSSSAGVTESPAAGSPTCTRVDALLDGEIATRHPIRMEVLAGARDESHLSDLRRLLARASVVDLVPGAYETVRKLIDCLIGAIAIRAGVPVLQADSDFEVLARHTSLHLADP